MSGPRFKAIATLNCYLFPPHAKTERRTYIVATRTGSKKVKIALQKDEYPGTPHLYSDWRLLRVHQSERTTYQAEFDTTVRSVAELRLRDFKAHHRGNPGAGSKSKGVMTFGDALNSYEPRFSQDVKTKEPSKKYRRQIIKALLKSWPKLLGTDLRKITEQKCLNWAKDLSESYSARRYNNTLGTLRAVIDIGIEKGYCSRNPALKPSKMRIIDKPLDLPSSEKFQEFITHMRDGGGRHSGDAADFAEFLAYSGCRQTEGSRAAWKHINFDKGELTVVGDPETGTKSWQYRTIPMVPDLVSLLQRIKNDRGGNPDPDEPICRVRECQRTMDRAAKRTQIARLTHHNLRDLFATTCIESGVAVPTVSKWLGHKDGGALCMKRYVNPRMGPGKEAATKVSFGRKNA